MQQDHLPTPLARAAMRVIPASVLQRMIDALMRGMRQSHPRLFSNLERLDAAVVRIEPSDLPHNFTLAFGHGETSLTVSDSKDGACSARLKGKLAALLDLLEGRIDGDMMFFSRSIEITGDTSVMVALRNTIDREEINLLDDMTALFGPFARPARHVASLIDKVGQRMKERIQEINEERSPDAQPAKAECDALRAEVQALKTRLAKLEVRRQRTEVSAQ